MNYIPGMDASALALMVMIILSVERIPKSRHNAEKKSIKAIEINIMLFLIYDMIYRLFCTSGSTILVNIAFFAKSVYFIEHGILIFLWNRYTGNLIWDEEYKNKWYKRIYEYSICLISVIVLINFFTPVLFRIGKNGEFIHYDICMYIITAVNYVNVIITYASLIKNRKRLKRKSLVLLLFYPVAPVVAEMLQLAFRNYDLMSLYAISALLMSKIGTLNDAMRDSLTGIGNRLLLDDKLKRWFSYRNEYICGVMIDIDNLKAVNDTYGHQAGDEAILMIAESINSMAKRFGLYPIRYGGDEFMLIWKSSTREEAQRMLADLRNDEKHFLNSTPGVKRVSYSTGNLICAPDDDMTAEDFLWLLDKRMYESKHAMESTIEYAMRNNGLQIAVQPIYYVPEKRLVSGEALLRMTDEEGTAIPPRDFIPVAEKTGSIYQLEHFVMTEVCRIASVPDFSERGIHRVGLNISATHAARESFPDYLIKIVDSFGIPHNHICVELTETAMSSNQEIYAKNIKKLHDSGFKLCMDDFGTGYSNLRRLSSLSLDMVKIDQELIASDSPQSRELVRLAVNIIHGLGYDVVAEGVETAEQAEFVKSLNVEYIQGFYYARPMRPDEFLDKFPGV